MASGGDTDEEAVNFYRYTSLIVDFGSYALRCTLDDAGEKHNPFNTFEDFLNDNIHAMYHLWQTKSCCKCLIKRAATRKSIMTKPQWDSLYRSAGHPCYGQNCACQYIANVNISTSVVDVSLASLILLNVAPISPDQRRDIMDLRTYRNTFHGHAKTAKMSCTDFRKHFLDARNVIESLFSKVPTSDLQRIKSEIDYLEHKMIDGALAKQICRLVQTHHEQILTLKEDIQQIDYRPHGTLKRIEAMLMSFHLQSSENTHLLRMIENIDDRIASQTWRVENRLDRIEDILLRGLSAKDDKDPNTIQADECAYKKDSSNVKQISVKELMKSLKIACMNGRQEEVHDILNNNPAAIDFRDHRGRTVLHYIAEGGNCFLLNDVLLRGLKVDVVDKRGHTLLHVSCLKGNFCLTEFLANNYFFLVNKKDNRGWYPVHHATASGHLEILKFLDANGAVNDNDSNIFHLLIFVASYNMRENILFYLQEKHPKKFRDHCDKILNMHYTLRNRKPCEL